MYNMSYPDECLEDEWTVIEGEIVLPQSSESRDVTLVQETRQISNVEPPVWLIAEFDSVWFDDRFVAKTLKDIATNAVTTTPKWSVIVDYNARLSAIKTWNSLKRNTPEVQVNIQNVFGKSDI